MTSPKDDGAVTGSEATSGDKSQKQGSTGKEMKAAAVDFSVLNGVKSEEEPELDDEFPEVPAPAVAKPSGVAAVQKSAVEGAQDLLVQLARAPATAAAPESGPKSTPDVMAAPSPSAHVIPPAKSGGGVSGGSPASALDAAVALGVGAITLPILGLSKAGRYLSPKLGAPGAALRTMQESAYPGVAMPTSALPPALMTGMEFVAPQKAEQILRSAEAVKTAARALKGTAQYAAVEEIARAVASRTGRPAHEFLSRLGDADNPAPDLRAAVDCLWNQHPGEVEAYQKAAHALASQCRLVEGKIANTEKGRRDALLEAISDVKDMTEFLPGFGDRLGHYIAPLCEKLLGILSVIAEMVRRVTGITKPGAAHDSVRSGPSA